MNFFERIRTGRLFNRKRNSQEEAAFLKKPEVPEMIIKFTFMERDYIIEAFELGFSQEINSKGKPGGLPRGGMMSITLSETPDYNINEWMVREEQLRDGLIRFFPYKGKVDEGALLTIAFFDAYCVRYCKKIDTLGAGLQTTIEVSPRLVKIGEEEFENNWKKQEPLSHYIKSK